MHLFTCRLLYNGLLSSFSRFVFLTVTSSLTCFLSEVHSLHANGTPHHHHHHHHVYLIKNQLKTPRRLVSRAEARLRLEQKRFPHSATFSHSHHFFLPFPATVSIALPHPLSSALLSTGSWQHDLRERRT